MAVVNLDFYSYELAMNTQATVLLPERRGVPCTSREGRPYPVLYLLHGHGQDHTSWLRLTRLENYLQNSDVIVVMPNGSRGCYVMILQDALSTLGYQTGSRIDGVFGARTEEALRGYQRRTSLRVDGVCGCNSWKKISTAVLGVGRTKTTID